ncbi:MAG: sigma factor-like helix-turn-helix DNA-binding protein [Patescibacteria group bacterium]
MAKLIFKPKDVSKRLIQHLPERSKDVIVSRYGLSDKKEAETLDAIGQRYGITRERVRQIENSALKSIQDSPAIQKEASALQHLESSIREMGAVLPEHSILAEFATDPETKNHLYFLMVVGKPFTTRREDDHFKARWFVDESVAKSVEDALKTVHSTIKTDDIVSEDKLVTHVLSCLSRVNVKYKNKETAKRWLELSNCLMKNPLGEWGRKTAPSIRLKNIRDHAYLVVKRHGSPMHFREVAKAIEKTFGKKAHHATTHNELIKDKRFVLVGRGIYALAEWGYRPGAVIDIMKQILKEKGPLTREELIKAVNNERHVKMNTILVNLQNSALAKNREGKYVLAK